MNTNETWYRKWGDDEYGESIAVIRSGNQYKIRRIIDAWEPQAGKRIYRTVSLAEAREFDPDQLGLDYDWYAENEAARVAGDKFFAS